MVNSDKKVAIVTGGTRGIGAAISRKLVSEGYVVVATYISNTAAADAFSAETGVVAHQCDVGDYEACGALARGVIEKYGAVYALVNNAGITRDAMFHKLTPEMWRDVMRTNLDSCYNMTSHVYESMRSQKIGRIINISSVNAQSGQLGQANYCAAKAGMIGFIKALAREGARFNITANAIAPGYIGTDMVHAVPEPVLEKIISTIPLARLGEVQEIAQSVSYLVSDAGAFMTGSTLSINGGQYML